MILFIVFCLSIIALAIFKNKRKKKTVYTVPVIDPKEAARQAREKEKARKEAERIEKEKQRQREKQVKAAQEKEQAKEDIPYLKNQLERFYKMIQDTETDLQIARQRVEYDSMANQYGSIVQEKEVNKHIADRDKLLNKLIKLENQIHAAEKKLNKAENILNRD